MTAEQVSLIDQEEDTMLGRYLTFYLDTEVYGIGIRHITEIIGIQPINTLPETPEYLRGIINLRGKIIPVIDMRLRFKKRPAEYTGRTCIIVAEIEEKLAGLIVDSVAEVMPINGMSISPPPELGTGEGSRYISGIGRADGKVILLLDPETLLNSDNEGISVKI